MNLKEAFRFQNRLLELMSEAEAILSDEENITRVETTSLRKKVMPEAENEVELQEPDAPSRTASTSCQTSCCISWSSAAHWRRPSGGRRTAWNWTWTQSPD